MMIKTLILLACILGYALAQDTQTVLGNWTGTTQNGPTFYPLIVGANPCSVVTDIRNYVVVNYTFAAAGVREVTLLAESSFKALVTVLLYKTSFTPSTVTTSSSSCTNYVTTLTNVNYAGDPGSMYNSVTTLQQH
jgi:hypothetical protein